jgi:KDO2-lipid IV(A) lauroyltransferase
MVNYYLYRIGQAIALSLPLRLGYTVAVFLSDIRHLYAFEDRRRVTENLKIIFPEKSEREIAKIRRKVFHNFAKYLVDFFRFNKIDLRYIDKNVKVENIQYIIDSLAEGKGAILLTAHLGNWELGGVVVSMLGYPLLSVALPHKSEKVNNFFNAQREGKGVSVLPLGNAAKGCLKALRRNGLLGLVGDRDFVGKGINVNFFGKPTIFPSGPAFFSLQTGAKIIPGFMLRDKGDKMRLVFEKPIEYKRSGDNAKDLAVITNSFRGVFEKYIRNYPDQWYLFRRFWKE